MFKITLSLEGSQNTMPNGNGSIRKEKKGKEFKPKKSPEDCEHINEIIKVFTRDPGNKKKPVVNPNLQARYEERAKQLIQEIDKKNIKDFVYNLPNDFKENPDDCQMIIWHIISDPLCEIIKSLDGLTYQVVQSQLESVIPRDKNFEKTFSIKNIG